MDYLRDCAREQRSLSSFLRKVSAVGQQHIILTTSIAYFDFSSGVAEFRQQLRALQIERKGISRELRHFERERQVLEREINRAESTLFSLGRLQCLLDFVERKLHLLEIEIDALSEATDEVAEKACIHLATLTSHATLENTVGTKLAI